MVEDPLILQWHISEACNLKCLHCYQEDHVPLALKFDELLSILDSYKELLRKTNRKGHINLTGGEPLVSPYFFKLLDIFHQDRDLYSYCILTNATLIDDEIAKKIASYEPLYVQLSLEGGKKTNDIIRGKGSFKKIIKGARALVKAGIYTSISFTANKINYKELEKVAKIAKRNHINRVWTDRYIPLNGNTSLCLSLEETKYYMLDIARLAKKYSNSKLDVSSKRALQFLETGGPCYHCTAGSSLITVMENGDVVLCRRMPIVAGNALESTLSDIFFNSKVFKDAREFSYPKDCELCDFANSCRGGLRCLTYAMHNSYDFKDLGCYFD